MFFTQNCVFAKDKKVTYTPLDEYMYEQKTYQNLVKEKFERSLLPESGFMSAEEYEKRSVDVPNSIKETPEPPIETSSYYMEYIPQPTYKLAKYNLPPGNDELNLKIKIKFKHQLNGEGITSPDKSFMVYPVTYYYPESQTTSGDLFVVPLDQTLSDIDRILRANTGKRNPEPILSTEKNIGEKYIFRTMTPIDFSADGTKLLAKEKIGYVDDGIWQTNLWIYDFTSKKATRADGLRDAIVAYWKKSMSIRLNLKRWDIYPIGFDAQNPDRIIVQAYGWTGAKPFFLGCWGVSTSGEKTELISPTSSGMTVSTNGFHLVQDGVVNPVELKMTKKIQKHIEKKHQKIEKQEKKKVLKEKRKEVKKEIKSMEKEVKKQKKLYEKYMQQSVPLGN